MQPHRTSTFVDFFVFPTVITACFLALNITGAARVPIFEFIPVMISLAGTLMLKRENAYGNLVIFIGQIFFMFYFIQTNLSGQLIFSALLAALNLIGFYFWTYPSGKTNHIITPTTLRPIHKGLICAGLGATVHFSLAGGIIGILDWTGLYLGIVGQILLTRKKIESWILFSIFSAICVVLFLLSESYLLALISLIYLPINVSAFYRWRKLSRRTE
jgi:nicotinamide mononucleotide transporter